MRDVSMEFLGDEIPERERKAADKAAKEANARADANAARAEKAETENKRLKKIIRKLTGNVAAL